MKRLIFPQGIVVSLLTYAMPVMGQGVWVGPGVPLQSAMIQNMTPLHCALIAYGEKFADIGPGETAYAGPEKKDKKVRPLGILFPVHGGFGWYGQSNNIQIPLAALCSTDAEHTQYVGAATTVFNVFGGGNSSVNTWIIRPSDIQAINGRSVENHPSASTLAVYHVRMPFPGMLAATVGTVAIQIVNNSPYIWRARAIFHGVTETIVHPGEVYYAPIKALAGIVIDIKAVDPARNDQLVGAWSQLSYGQATDTSAQSFILNKGSFH